MQKLIVRAAAIAAFAGVAYSFHCSNDAPTPLDAPPQKAGAFEVMPLHMRAQLQAGSEHDHASAGAPLPGYGAANTAIARSLRGVKDVPPALVASPFNLDQVELLAGGRGYQLQTLSAAWLQQFNADSFLYNFRQTANISTGNATSYGGWEDPTCLLRGHIAGGHFLSGAAMLVNATGDAKLKSVLSYMVGELAVVQAALSGTAPAPGYLSAFPADHFDRLETNTQPIWAPYYTIHKVGTTQCSVAAVSKRSYHSRIDRRTRPRQLHTHHNITTTLQILRGLYDIYTLVGDNRTIAIASNMLSYFAARIRNVIAANTIAAWWAILNIEHGGMNEVARNWYDVTGQADAMFVAQHFDKVSLHTP